MLWIRTGVSRYSVRASNSIKDKSTANQGFIDAQSKAWHFYDRDMNKDNV